MEQYHIKFVEKSHHLKRHGRKAFVQLVFSWSYFASQSTGFVHAFTYIFNSPAKKFWISFSIKEDDMHNIIMQ